MFVRAPLLRHLPVALASLLTLSATSRARADQAEPPRPIAAVKGTISRAQPIEIDASTKFILIEISDLSEAAPPAAVRAGSRLVPYPGDCAKAWAAIVSKEPDAAGVVGKSVDGLLVPSADPPDKTARRTCPLLEGHVNLMREASALPSPIDWRSHAKTQKDAILPPLGAMRDFFVPSRDGFVESPLERDVHDALSELDSEASLAFALERRMYFFADFNHFKWRRNPSNFAVVSRDLLERPWATVGSDPPPGRVPHGSLTDLFWMTSPSQAASTLRALYDKDADKAMRVLRSSPPRDDVFDLLLELTERDRTRWLAGTLGELAMDGNERTLAFMQKELPTAGSDAPGLAKRLEAIDRRAQLGVSDGLSLGRHFWSHRDDPYSKERPFEGMRVELVGPSDGCCSIVHDLGDGVRLEGKVDCDAESFVATCKVPRGTIITAVGVVTSHYVGASDKNRYVRIDLGSASARVGGTVAATPPSPNADDPPRGATSGAPGSSGCTCAIVASPSVSRPGVCLLVLGLLVAASRRHPRRSARTSRGARHVSVGLRAASSQAKTGHLR